MTERTLKAIARDLVEQTAVRPGFQYLLVDSDLFEELADKVGAKIGNNSADPPLKQELRWR